MIINYKKKRKLGFCSESGCLGGNNSAAAQATQQQQQQQSAIASATNKINTDFSGFNPAFYSNYTNANENQGLGQLAQQQQQTQNQLGFKLAGQGLSNSSAGQQLGQSLQQEAGTQKQNVVNSALGATNTLQQNIAQEQNSLISQANVANDPSSVANQALGVASSFSSPSPIAPIGQAFSNWANTWLGATNASTANSAAAAQSSSYPAYYGGTSFSGGYGSSLTNPVSSVGY